MNNYLVSLDSKVIYLYSFLINNGFTPKQALDLIRQRYSLPRTAEKLLKRCIHSYNLNRIVQSKLVTKLPTDILCVDGYNQFYTLYSALQYRIVYHCSDGLLRDALASTIRLNDNDIKHLSSLMKKVLIGIKKLIIILDSQHPYSGRHASILRKTLPNALIAVSRTADKTLIVYARKGYTIASSDIVVVLHAHKVFDLAKYIIDRAFNKIRVIDIASHLKSEHKKWCSQGP